MKNINLLGISISIGCVSWLVSLFRGRKFQRKITKIQKNSRDLNSNRTLHVDQPNPHRLSYDSYRFVLRKNLSSDRLFTNNKQSIVVWKDSCLSSDPCLSICCVLPSTTSKCSSSLIDSSKRTPELFILSWVSINESTTSSWLTSSSSSSSNTKSWLWLWGWVGLIPCCIELNASAEWRFTLTVIAQRHTMYVEFKLVQREHSSFR